MTSKYRGMGQNGLPMLIFDILETWCGDWLTMSDIFTEVSRFRPGVRRATVERAVWRLCARGLVERRAGIQRSKVPPRFGVRERAYLHPSMKGVAS